MESSCLYNGKLSIIYILGVFGCFITHRSRINGVRAHSPHEHFMLCCVLFLFFFKLI